MLAVVVGGSYFIFNLLNYTAPMSLYDEIGYLSKAMALAGSPVDMASSWFGGYSLFLVPAFWLFSDPQHVWNAVLALNGIMWGISCALLWYILRSVFPKKHLAIIAITTLFVFLFPSFLGMSGHAFSTTGLVFVMMCALATLVKSRLQSAPWLLLFAFLVGFLMWIHPTSIVIVVAISALFIVKSIQERTVKKYAAVIVLPIIIGAFYTLVVHGWLNGLMTPEGFGQGNHYGSPTRLLSNFTDIGYWKNVVLLFLGQFSSILIGTLGIIVFGVQHLFDAPKRNIKSFLVGLTKDPLSMVIAISALSLIGLLVIAAFSFAPMAQGYTRADVWVYTRYTEIAVLPLIAIGILSKWRLKLAAYTALLILVTAVLFFFAVDESNTKFSALHLSNMQSFWPLQFIGGVSYVGWFILGAAAIILVGILGRWNKKWLVGLLIIPLFIGQIGVQQDYWKSHTQQPSGLVDFVRDNYATGTCIGFVDIDEVTTVKQGLRFRMYSFYFHDYDFRRVTPETWQEDCGGLYLSYDADLLRNTPGARIVAREQGRGLYVAISQNQDDVVFGGSYTDLYTNFTDSDCVQRGCFSWRPDFTSTKTKVGKLSEGRLETAGQEGSLLYGPYLPIKKGTYTLTLRGDFWRIDNDTRLEIASGSGDNRAIYLNESLSTKPEQKYTFTIPEWTEKAEVKIFVGKHADISLESYDIGQQ